MLSISRKSDYGLLLLTLLAKKRADGFVSIKSLAGKSRLPYRFLSQIAGELKDAGFLESKEGVSGGYRLKKKPEKISVGQVLDVLEGSLAPVECLRGKDCVCEEFCLHKGVMGKVASAVIKATESYSLKDLVGESRA